MLWKTTVRGNCKCRRAKLHNNLYQQQEEALRWLVVFKTGWTLAEVDALSEQDWQEFWAIRDGLIKSRKW